MIKFLDLGRQYRSMEGIEKKIVEEIRRGEYINGESKSRFEEEFSKYIGRRYCVGVGNGTDALEIGIRALNIEEGSEVIIQSNTFIATCLGATYNKLRIVFADVDKRTMMIDLEDVESKITERTKLIIVVHLYGNSCDMERLSEICRRNKIKLIEDCAQSHGGMYRGRKLGTYGDISCFSFYPGKNLGCYGDGGGICMDEGEYYEFIRRYINLGSKKKYEHEIIGRNSRLDSVQSVILMEKLRYLDEWNKRRREIAKRYDERMLEIGVEKMEEGDGSYCVYHLYVIKVEKREEFMRYMRERGIETLIHYPIPCHKSGAYRENNKEKIEVVEELSEKIVSLPIYAELEDREVEYICDKIEEYIKR